MCEFLSLCLLFWSPRSNGLKEFKFQGTRQLRLCSHVTKQRPICECDIWDSVDFLLVCARVSYCNFQHMMPNL